MRISAEHPVFSGRTYNNVNIGATAIRNLFSDKQKGIGGVRLSKDGPQLVYSPQHFELADVNFYRVRGQKWSPNPTISFQHFPLRTDSKEGDIVPIAGGIYIGQRKLSDDELAKAGLTAIRDESGAKISYPYLCPWGARVLTDVRTGNVQVFGQLTDQGDSYRISPHITNPFIPKTMEDLTNYLRVYLLMTNQTGDDLIAQLNSELKSAWEKCSPESDSVDNSTFERRFRICTLLNIIGEELSKTNSAGTFKSCGLQFKGSGGHYVGRIILRNQLNQLVLNDGEKVFDDGRDPNSGHGGKRARVGFPALFERFGIFLDQVHQPPPSSPDPVGGMIVSDTQAVQLDDKLLRNGAVMAGISFSSIKLLDQDVIRRTLGLTTYQSGDLHVLARAAGSDTRRLEFLKSPAFYRLYIDESYDGTFEEGRERHLMKLSENIGKNIRAAFLSEITAKVPIIDGVRGRPMTANNLSPIGEIYDSTELVPARKSSDYRSVSYYWLEDLFNVAEAAGFDAKEFLGDGRFLKSLIKGFLEIDQEFPIDVLEELKNMERTDAIVDIAGSLVMLKDSL